MIFDVCPLSNVPLKMGFGVSCSYVKYLIPRNVSKIITQSINLKDQIESLVVILLLL